MSHKNLSYFEVRETKKFVLSNFPTHLKPLYKSDENYEKLLSENQLQIEEFQTLLYASHQKGLLIVLQGMDTAGKDGAIKHITMGMNAQGCSVTSFKTPTQTELDHDFLWRSNQSLPARGQIQIFNRSYYEEVLITKVHPKLVNAEKLERKPDKHFWNKRYQDINHFEHYLHRQNYEIIKIFIHISKTEQKNRLLLRFQDPKKHWKISEGDIHERLFWKQYQKAYQDCIQSTASESCPWYIVPGDDKRNARLSISQILVERFKKMKLNYPKLSREEEKNLKKLQAQLIK